MKVDLKETKLYPALRWASLFRLNRRLGLLLGGVSLLLGTSFIFPDLPRSSLLKTLFPKTLSLFLLSRLGNSFFEESLKKRGGEERLEDASSLNQQEIAARLSFEVAEPLFKQGGEVEPNRLLLALLGQKETEFVLQRLLLPKKNLKKRLREGVPEPGGEVLSLAAETAAGRGKKRIREADLLFALSKENKIFGDLLTERDLYPRDVFNLARAWERSEEKKRERKKWWSFKNLLKKGSLGRNFAAGYTVLLDSFSRDLSRLTVRKGGVEIVDREEELKRSQRVLSRREGGGVLLVGEEGSGRKSLLLALASRIGLGESTSALNYKKVALLKPERILSRTKDRKEVVKTLEKIFLEARSAANVVLVIEGLHNLVAAPEQGGLFDASGLIVSSLQKGGLRIVGTTSPREFHRKIEGRSSLSGLFEEIGIEALSKEETLLVLQRRAVSYEQERNVFIPYPVLRTVVDHAGKFISEPAFPEKAVDLLSGTVSFVKNERDRRVVKRKDVAEVVTQRTKIPVGKVKEEEKEVLLNLEDLIHKRLINQDRAVREVAEALRRRRSRVGAEKGPIGSFLFMGPTGVGKTETAKCLSRVYFGGEERMIRFDMSEFQNKEDIVRFIGTEEEAGRLSKEVRKKPFSLLLLDEIEKAHPDLLNLFLQIIDEGYFTDGMGRKINLENTIIIGTSNAGYRIILEGIERGTKREKVREEVLDYVFSQGLFRPEFINRFDAVVLFRTLTRQNLLDIAGLMLGDLEERLKEKNFIDLQVTKPLKRKVVELSYDPRFGAREMKRVIQDKVEGVLARAVLAEKIGKGDRVKVTSEFKIVEV